MSGFNHVAKMPSQPFCICCGSAIAKFTRTEHISWSKIKSGEAPRNRADLATLTNLRVISVRYWRDQDGSAAQRFIDRYSTWDGESYVDQYFCDGTCGSRFAYIMANSGHMTVVAKRKIKGSERCSAQPSR